MAVGKRTSLRAKAGRRKDIIHTNRNVIKRQAKNKLLERLTIQNNKNQISNPNLDPKQPGISKSAIRRRKRKLREQLAAKLGDLKNVLDETVKVEKGEKQADETELLKATDESISRKKLDHRPNPQTKRGLKKVQQEEEQRFSAVLKEKSFQENPFKSLKESILKNMN